MSSERKGKGGRPRVSERSRAASKRGVIWYVSGLSHIERLLVSVSSVRRLWSGPALALHEGAAPAELRAALSALGAECAEVETGESAPLAGKIAALSASPFEETMFLDADTLAVEPIDEYFAMLEGADFVFTHFSGWSAADEPVASRLRSWCRAGLASKAEIGEAMRRPAINIGSFAFRRGARFLSEWLERVRAGVRAGLFIPDELAAQLALPRLSARIAGPEWGASPVFGKHIGNPKVIHFHGGRHAGRGKFSRLWEQEKDRLIEFFAGRNQVSVREGVEVVTAVDRQYLRVLRESWMTWNFPPETPVKIICLGGVGRKDLDFVDAGRRDVSFHPWDMRGRGVTRRERALSSFVLFAPRIVEGEYWIKLDADCHAAPGADLFSDDRFYEYDLVSHPWIATKPGRWLRLLEEWGDRTLGGERVFTRRELAAAEKAAVYRCRRVPRFQSFVCLHRTEFSRWAASLAGRRLPVPSHDTYLWYVLVRSGRAFAAASMEKAGWHHGGGAAARM